MLNKYAALFRMKYVEMFAYQLASMVWLLGSMVQPLITMMVWMNIYEDQSNTFILYFSILIFVERMTNAWDVWELETEIREGSFSNRILKPFHPIHSSIAENIVYKGLFVVALIPAWVVLAIFIPVLRVNMTGSQWVLFFIALILAAAIRFIYSYVFGLLGFWTNKVTALYITLEAVSLFISGRIAPFSLLPPVIRQISIFLPYRYIIGFPVEVVTGAVQGKDILYGFTGSILWVVLFILIFQFLWNAGLKKNQAVGG